MAIASPSRPATPRALLPCRSTARGAGRAASCRAPAGSGCSGAASGLGEGALPLYRRARERLGPDVRLVWLATTDAELRRARELGLDAVAKHQRAGLWLTLRARVLVVTHGAGDVNRYGTRGGFLVQLWHGIPLKKLHLDSPVARVAPDRAGALIGRRSWLAATASPGAGSSCSRSRPNASSAGSRPRFGMPRDRIAATGDPRDDVLLDGPPNERRARARALLESAGRRRCRRRSCSTRRRGATARPIRPPPTPRPGPRSPTGSSATTQRSSCGFIRWAKAITPPAAPSHRVRLLDARHAAPTSTRS